MKTLIFNGSPRKHGNTGSLIEKLVKRPRLSIRHVQSFAI